MATTISMHNQLKDMFSGSGSSASSTTSLTAVFEGLASDTKKLLETNDKHFSKIEKLLSDNNKFLKNTGSKSWLNSILDGVMTGLGMGFLKTGKIGKILRFFGILEKEAVAAEKAVGVLKSGGMVTRLFGTIRGALSSSFSWIGNTVKAAGTKLASWGSSVFSFLKLEKIGAMFEGFAKFGTLFKGVLGYLPKVAGLVGKLAWPITIIMGLIDGVSGWTNASEILGRQVDGFGGRLIASIGSIVNGLFLGIPDWAANQLNFKNFASMLDAGAGWVGDLGNSLYDGVIGIGTGIVNYFKGIFSYFGDLVSGLVGSSPEESGAKAQYLKKANTMANKMALVYSGAVTNRTTKEDRDAAYVPRRSIMREGTPETPNRANAFKSRQAVSASAVAQTALDTATSSEGTVIMDAMGNVASTNAAIANQLPSEMRPYMSVISGALTGASQSMVSVYANLQTKAQEEEAKRKDDWWTDFKTWFNKPSTSAVISSDGMVTDAMGNIMSPASYSSSSSGANNQTSGSASTQTGPVRTDPHTGAILPPLPSDVGDWDNKGKIQDRAAILKREMKKELPNWSDDQIAGFIGNMQGESQLKTNIQEGRPISGRGGYGLMQWTGQRRVALEQFAKDQGKSVDDPSLQIAFMGKEARGEIGTEKGGYDKFLAASAGKGPDAALAAAVQYVERPKVNNSGQRIAEANRTGVMSVAPAAELKKFGPLPNMGGARGSPAGYMGLYHNGSDEGDRARNRATATPTSSSSGISPEAPKMPIAPPANARVAQPSSPRLPESITDMSASPRVPSPAPSPVFQRDKESRDTQTRRKAESATNDTAIRVKDVAPLDEMKMLAINGSTLI
jgi:hypothetical protein